jgi:hypothetical protein
MGRGWEGQLQRWDCAGWASAAHSTELPLTEDYLVPSHALDVFLELVSEGFLVHHYPGVTVFVVEFCLERAHRRHYLLALAVADQHNKRSVRSLERVQVGRVHFRRVL